MHLRAANTCDLALLFNIHRSVFRFHIEKLWGWDEEWQRENFALECAAAVTSVVEIDSQIAGYIQILNQESQIYVQNIAIAVDRQGNGVGTMLLKCLQSRAAAQQVPLHLGVFRTNTSAQKLYKRLGFHDVGETRTHIEMSWTDSPRASEGRKS